MSLNRNATKKARGFNYQRKYVIYLFLKYISDTDNYSIIEEGEINGKVYEDITIIKNNHQIETYQIKYHENKSINKIRLNRSNEELFKTILNQNNLDEIVETVYFLVSKIEPETYDEDLNNWINGNLNSRNLYEKILNLDKKDNKIINKYNELIKFLKEDPELKINYLNKLKLLIGLSYNDLDSEINEIIKNRFDINNIILIYYVKYMIFDLFEKNWFENNIPILINQNYISIKSKLNQYNNIQDIEKINILFERIIIDNYKKIYINNISSKYDNFHESIDMFININNNDIDLKKYFILLLMFLSKIYKNNIRIYVYQYFIKIIDIIIIHIIKFDNSSCNDINDVLISIIYYKKSIIYYKKCIEKNSCCKNKNIDIYHSAIIKTLSQNDMKYIESKKDEFSL